VLHIAFYPEQAIHFLIAFLSACFSGYLNKKPFCLQYVINFLKVGETQKNPPKTDGGLKNWPEPTKKMTKTCVQGTEKRVNVRL